MSDLRVPPSDSGLPGQPPLFALPAKDSGFPLKGLGSAMWLRMTHCRCSDKQLANIIYEIISKRAPADARKTIPPESLRWLSKDQLNALAQEINKSDLQYHKQNTQLKKVGDYIQEAYSTTRSSDRRGILETIRGNLSKFIMRNEIEGLFENHEKTLRAVDTLCGNVLKQVKPSGVTPEFSQQVKQLGVLSSVQFEKTNEFLKMVEKNFEGSEGSQGNLDNRIQQLRSKLDLVISNVQGVLKEVDIQNVRSLPVPPGAPSPTRHLELQKEGIPSHKKVSAPPEKPALATPTTTSISTPELILTPSQIALTKIENAKNAVGALSKRFSEIGKTFATRVDNIQTGLGKSAILTEDLSKAVDDALADVEHWQADDVNFKKVDVILAQATDILKAVPDDFSMKSTLSKEIAGMASITVYNEEIDPKALLQKVQDLQKYVEAVKPVFSELDKAKVIIASLPPKLRGNISTDIEATKRSLLTKGSISDATAGFSTAKRLFANAGEQVINFTAFTNQKNALTEIQDVLSGDPFFMKVQKFMELDNALQNCIYVIFEATDKAKWAKERAELIMNFFADQKDGSPQIRQLAEKLGLEKGTPPKINENSEFYKAFSDLMIEEGGKVLTFDVYLKRRLQIP